MGCKMISKETFQEWLPVVLVWFCLVLLPVGRSVEGPVAIMALLGLWSFAKGGWRECRQGGRGTFTLVMLLLWIPQLLALPDAANLSRSAGGALSFLRFYFSGYYIITSITSRRDVLRICRLCSYVLMIWVVDALIQSVAGTDLFGYTLRNAERVNGVFGDKLKLGPFLTLFAPILFFYARTRLHLVLQVVVFLATCAALLVAGSRSSWVMLLVIVAGYLVYLWSASRRFKLWHLLATAVAGVALLALCAAVYPPFQERMEQTALLFRGDRESVDTALSARLVIWDVAVRMIKDHPVNGVGVRGFRYVYPEYAAADDLFMRLSEGTTGPTHAHMLILEILTETGLIGLLGYLLAVTLLVVRWVRLGREARALLLPFALATLAALLPINTHMAFYSASLAQVIYLLMALYHCDMASSEGQDAPAAAASTAA